MNIVSQSGKMQLLLKMVNKVALSECNVLLDIPEGHREEAWEITKNYIHANSERKNKPLIHVDCSKSNSDLLSEELFGTKEKIGLLQICNGGTLVLEHIYKLSQEDQLKLLDLIKTKKTSYYNSKEIYSCDVRTIVIGTEEEVYLKVVMGELREDLFYRLNTIVQSISSLNERESDIPDYMTQIMNTLSKTGQAPRLDKDSVEFFKKRHWERGIDELKDICQKLINLNISNLTLSLIPESIKNPNHETDSLISFQDGITLTEVENQYILKALKAHNDNKAQTAKSLGITIKTLYNRLYEIKHSPVIPLKPVEAKIDYHKKNNLETVERVYILKALNHFKGNKTQTAQSLGISIKTLYNKLHGFGETENESI